MLRFIRRVLAHTKLRSFALGICTRTATFLKDVYKEVIKINAAQ